MLSIVSSIDGIRWRRWLMAAVAALLVLGAVPTYAVLAHRHHSAPAATPVHPRYEGPIDDHPFSRSTPGRQVVATADPEAFARSVAETLFAWDTATTLTTAEVTEQLAAVADPTGESSADLLHDIANYLPADEAWTQLRTYATRQWLQITSTRMPSLWSTAVGQAEQGLLPGTTGFSIRGIRHRSGVWEGEPVSTTHEVAFTVFIVCGPSYPTCRLLRLSLPDQPLR